jgi:hypothetical protein
LFAVALIAIGIVGWRVGVHVELKSTVGEVGVAIGTLALAFFTWQLALQTKAEVFQTRRELDLTQKSLDLTRESIEAGERPYVIPSGFKGTGRIFLRYSADLGWHLRVGLWNLGKGPGIVRDVQLLVNGQHVLQPLKAEIPISHVQPSVADQLLPLESRYTDKSGKQPILALPDGIYSLLVFYRQSSGKELMTTTSVTRTDDRLLCAGFVRIAPGRLKARSLQPSS